MPERPLGRFAQAEESKLTLARAIAEQHGGALRLANRVGAGGVVEGLVAELRLPVG